MNQLTNYIKATLAEMQQVAWPTQRQAFIYTLLVIAISVIVALYVGAFDYVFSNFINFLIQTI